jgi:hypothetical protein
VIVILDNTETDCMSIHPSLQFFQQKINIKYLSNIKNEAFLNIDNPARLNKLTGYAVQARYCICFVTGK